MKQYLMVGVIAVLALFAVACEELPTGTEDDPIHTTETVLEQVASVDIDCPEDAALFWSGITNAHTACVSLDDFLMENVARAVGLIAQLQVDTQ